MRSRVADEVPRSTVDDPAPGRRTRSAAILRTIGAALGAISAGVVVVAVAVIVVVAVLCLGGWLLIRTFTTVGSSVGCPAALS